MQTHLKNPFSRILSQTLVVNSQSKLLSISKEFALFLFLFASIVIVNYPIISADMMFPEQPYFYYANQQIKTFWDLVNIYLHPQLFEIVVPFFRPSGHFLMYQILTPIFGWHNTRALIIVNFFFLALSAYLMLKIYRLLFPNFKLGGYVAVGFYMMHPALILSRIIIMHFEFAYVFFTLLGLYCFMLFAREENYLIEKQKVIFKSYIQLALSMLFFTIAITFKEPALILGPILCAYFIIKLKASPLPWKVILFNKNIIQVLLFIFLCTIMLTLYLMLPWHQWDHPSRESVNTLKMLWATKHLLAILLSLSNFHFIKHDFWGMNVSPLLSAIAIWVLIAISLCTIIKILTSKVSNGKWQIIFLIVSFGLTLLLPVGWAMAMPWHLSLSILFFSFIAGFSLDSLVKSKIYNIFLLTSCSVLLMTITLYVDEVNLDYLNSNYVFNFSNRLIHNAFRNPPVPSSQFNDKNLILTEDYIYTNKYLIGGVVIPSDAVLDQVGYDLINQLYFLKTRDVVFNSMLFKWVYLNPDVKETHTGYQVDLLNKVSDLGIYQLMCKYNQTYFLGYDKDANWVDKTSLYKKKLLHEAVRRHLNINQYQKVKQMGFRGHIISKYDMRFPMPADCKFACDKNNKCVGITLVDMSTVKIPIIQCQLFDKIDNQKSKKCELCTGYIKQYAKV